MSQESTLGIIVHAITADNATDDELSNGLELCRSVFAYPGDSERSSHQLGPWQQYIQQSESVLLLATHGSAFERPLGLIFVVLRAAPEIGVSLPHIWLAGVEAESRGLGLFVALMDRAVEHASSHGHKEMTVCTYPARFEKMYRILQQTGWQEVARREGGQKVLMKLAI